MTATSTGDPWPLWAKVLLAAIALLTLATVLPWLLMWTTMSAMCGPLMGDMQRMMDTMRPEMMR